MDLTQGIGDALQDSPGEMTLLMQAGQPDKAAACLGIMDRAALAGQLGQENQALGARFGRGRGRVEQLEG